VHIATIDVLTNLLEMGKAFSTDEVPAYLRSMMKLVERSKPMLTAELASVPPEAIVEFMKGIGEQIDLITGASTAQIPNEEAAS
jgi:hypothetical protein